MTLKVSATRGCCSHHGGVSGCSSSGRLVCNDGTLSPSCTCTPTVTYTYGCTDKNASNYNSSANRDDDKIITERIQRMAIFRFQFNTEYVSFIEPVNATLFPSESITMPIFSWNMPAELALILKATLISKTPSAIRFASKLSLRNSVLLLGSSKSRSSARSITSSRVLYPKLID